LRILDSKDPGDRALVAGAPVFGDYLNQASRDFFAAVTAGLDALGIVYQLNPRLVRGLDYYCHTAFEFTTTDLGAQGTVMGGGRYDGLVAIMGGPPTPGAGWAAGIERIAMMLAQSPPARRPIAVVPVGSTADAPAAAIAERLRRAGYAVDLGYGGNLGKRMKRADKLAAAAAVILGEDELAKGVASLRDLDSGEQTAVPLAELEERLARFR
jgi:histidyl-tRNA synthetase